MHVVQASLSLYMYLTSTSYIHTFKSRNHNLVSSTMMELEEQEQKACKQSALLSEACDMCPKTIIIVLPTAHKMLAYILYMLFNKL